MQDGLPDLRRRDRPGLARVFRHYAEVEAPRLGSRVYGALSAGIADDEFLLDLAGDVRAHEPAPNVLFAAVQDLLLRAKGAGDRLPPIAEFYPAVSGRPIPDASPVASFSEFCREHADRLRPVLRTGRTQTSVVERCAALVPALARLPAGEGARAIALLEIGPSVGLNLRLDHYRYDYGAGRVWGNPSALPRFSVDTRGGTPPPLPSTLDIVCRRGLELHPLDPSRPEVGRWLRALVWPEHAARLRAMEQALRVAAAVPAEIVEGDATVDLDVAVERLPLAATAVVVATQVLYQLSPAGRDAVRAGLCRASVARPVVFVSMESDGSGESRLERRVFERGDQISFEDLARVESHGRRLRWGPPVRG